MNAGVISALFLLAVLAYVFYVYEKKKVSIKEISLIATLAALAGVLRVPFAALPNIQPTTFLVVISGYIFGPMFGFMVGGIAALTSNCFLGQGPWTPWQMLAWGLAGCSGGYLKTWMKSPNPWVLSLFLFAWGFLFGWIMNIWHWLVYVYPHTLKTLIATNINGLYFQLMHGVGNFVFAFLFGKDFIKILSRFKERIYFEDGSFEEKKS